LRLWCEDEDTIARESEAFPPAMERYVY
jgi:hypothetical protein